MYKYNIAKHFDGKKKDIEETHSKKWQIDVIRFNNRQASLLVIKKKRSFKFHEMLLYRMGWVMKFISSYKRISMYLNFACFFLLKVCNKALWCFSSIFLYMSEQIHQKCNQYTCMLNYKLQLMPIPLKGEYWKQIPLNIDLWQPKLRENTHTISIWCF